MADRTHITDEELNAAIEAGARDAREAGFDPGSAEPLPYAELDWRSDPGPRRWLVEGLIPAGRLSALYGPGEVGKSRLLLQLALAVIDPADGPLLPGHGPDIPVVRTHGAAVLVTWEDEADEVARRYHMARRAGAVPVGADPDVHLRVVDMRQVGGPLWAPGAGGHVSTEGSWTEAGRQLLALMERDRPALLVIDPIAAAYACSELDRALVRRFTAALDAAAEANGVTVVLAGHPPKGEAGYSGSTDWRNGVRGMLTLRSVKTRYYTPQDEPIEAPALVRDKSNYGPGRDPIWLRSLWSPASQAGGAELAWFAADEDTAAHEVDPGASLNKTAKTAKRGHRSAREGDDAQASDGPVA